MSEMMIRQNELYSMFSKLNSKQQAEAVASMDLTEEEKKTFLLSMAFMKLFNDKEYYEALKNTMAKEMYEYFNK